MTESVTLEPVEDRGDVSHLLNFQEIKSLETVPVGTNIVFESPDDAVHGLVRTDDVNKQLQLTEPLKASQADNISHEQIEVDVKNNALVDNAPNDSVVPKVSMHRTKKVQSFGRPIQSGVGSRGYGEVEVVDECEVEATPRGNILDQEPREQSESGQCSIADSINSGRTKRKRSSQGLAQDVQNQDHIQDWEELEMIEYLGEIIDRSTAKSMAELGAVVQSAVLLLVQELTTIFESDKNKSQS